jgi:ribose-phosphate pyrophosphokinase
MLTVNGVKIEPTIFPDKTSQIWKLDESVLRWSMTFNAPVVVIWKFESEAEFVHLLQLKALLDAYGAFGVELYIPYLPYARQDKSVSNTTTFALLPFLEVLRGMKFEKIVINDPHNEEPVRKALGASAEFMYPINQVKEVWCNQEIDFLCYPDMGARRKYSRIYTGMSYIYGNKNRDQLTGMITGYELVLPEISYDLSGKNVLIVDDLCDAGGTFILLAKELFAAGASKVLLFVSHGLFTKGTDVIFDSGIQRIYTKEGEVFRHGND